jgi:hypothetical protein
MIVKAQTILAGQAVTIRPIRKSDAAMEATFIIRNQLPRLLRLPLLLGRNQSLG